MSAYFADHNANACCLCGSEQKLTGEHKIKASLLRTEFGAEGMVIGRFGEPNDSVKSAQGVKSKALHFNAPMCAGCNNKHTQAPDLAFDGFNKSVSALVADGCDPKLVFEKDEYALGSEQYLNVFRYFAKLLCCQMADIGAPRRIHMARYATGLADENCVWLDIDEDWTYKKTSAEFGSYQYAAHGGLVVYGDKQTGGPNAFHSTLTIGGLRYIFRSGLNLFEQLDLRANHPEFYQWCEKKVEQFKNEPMSAEDLLRLGL